MRLSWLAINRTLIGAGLLVAGSIWFLPSAIVEWISKWESELFTGSLIGVIRDHDPKYCYAMLKWPDSRIQLMDSYNCFAIEDSFQLHLVM